MPKHWDRDTVPLELKNDRAIKKAAAALDHLSLNKEEREIGIAHINNRKATLPSAILCF